MRNKIWYTLVECKTNEFYTSYIIKYYQWSEWITNTFLVVTTSSSVAAWIVWKKFPVLWATIIACSQLVMLLKPFLLFPKYIKAYNEKNLIYQNLSWELEMLWYNLETKKCNDTFAVGEIDRIKRKLIDTDRFPDEIIVITHRKALTKAENKFESYKNQLTHE